MTRNEWKEKVLDAVDRYTECQLNGGDGRQSTWDAIKELLDQCPPPSEADGL